MYCINNLHIFRVKRKEWFVSLKYRTYLEQKCNLKDSFIWLVDVFFQYFGLYCAFFIFKLNSPMLLQWWPFEHFW